MDNPTGEVRAYKIDQRTRIIRLWLPAPSSPPPFSFYRDRPYRSHSFSSRVRTRSITSILLDAHPASLLAAILFPPSSCSMTTGLHGRSPIEIPPYGIGVPSEKYIAAQYLARSSPRNFASRTKIADRLSPWSTFRILERDGTFFKRSFCERNFKNYPRFLLTLIRWCAARLNKIIASEWKLFSSQLSNIFHE